MFDITKMDVDIPFQYMGVWYKLYVCPENDQLWLMYQNDQMCTSWLYAFRCQHELTANVEEFNDKVREELQIHAREVVRQRWVQRSSI